MHRHVPSSRALSFVDRPALDSLLAPLVPGQADRQFVLRCLLDEGPLHHRGANDLLVRLVGRVLERVPGDDVPAEGVRVPLRLPPHLEGQVEEGHFPLTLPTGALRALLGNDEAALEAAVDCLTDGPPQHALANVVLVALLERVLTRLEARP
jgi:hypothetical protein